MKSSSDWAWVWMFLGGGALIGEMMTPGSFFLMPFVIGAAVATPGAFAGWSVGLQWVSFLAVSATVSVAFIPLRRRLDKSPQADGIGSKRLVNQSAIVLDDIGTGPDGIGSIRVGREEWRSISATGEAIASGTAVQIIEVRGTSAVVAVPKSENKGANT